MATLADGRVRQGVRPGPSGFKLRYREAEDIKRLNRFEAIPIAVLVPRVRLKKRLDIEKLVAGRIPRVIASIESQIRGVS